MMKKFLVFLILIPVLLSCSTSKMLISPHIGAEQVSKENLPDWISKNGQRHVFDGLVYYVANNDNFLFVMMELANPQFARDAMRYGLTLYFDKDFRRSYGITYPTGILYGLSFVPGARKGYLENPGWENNPENRRIIETVEREMPDRALLMQRNDKSGDSRPAEIPVSHLEAQGMLLFFDNSGRVPVIAMQVPLELSRNQQFAVDLKPGAKIHFGIEVRPPLVEDIENDDYSVTSRDPYSHSRQQQQHRDAQMRSNMSVMLRGGFEIWTRLELSKSTN